jgi:hypothetical protein
MLEYRPHDSMVSWSSQTRMDLQQALDKATQVLDEERVSPTVSYDYMPKGSEVGDFSVGMAALQGLASLAGAVNISSMRKQRPREIQIPSWYRFKSTNYNLLCALLSRLKESDRPGFASVVALRLSSAPGCAAKIQPVSFPGWNNFSSELPLVAEFLVRNNGKAHLFQALWEAERIRGHACLLRQLEEMISFNYTIFTESDYETLARAMLNISAQAAAKQKEYRKGSNINVLTTGFCMEIEASSKAIAEQCRKARYMYVKESLSEGLNLEVNQDKIVVEKYIQQYGFPHALVESLNEAERLYRDGKTPFDFKASMSNLRSFLESVHAEAMPALHTKFGGQLPQKWGDGLAYLARYGVLSKTEEEYVSSLYKLISDEGVHPLIAEKEDARLTWNSVIEYALRFFRKVEKLGIKVAIAARP